MTGITDEAFVEQVRVTYDEVGSTKIDPSYFCVNLKATSTAKLQSSSTS
jgi:hypothetical protein